MPITIIVNARDQVGATASTTVTATQSAASAWPDATTTGVRSGVALTNSGSITTTANGQVISAKNVSGSITINHNNVTIEDCKIKSSTLFPVRLTPGRTGFTIRYCEIDNMAAAGGCAINGTGTIQRCNIYNTENGWNYDGVGPSLFEANYVHDLKAGGSPHYDGLQIDGNASGVIIRGNNIINPWGQTSAVMIDNYFGPISDILVENNRLIGGGYTVYSDGQFSGGSISGVRFINNRMGKGGYGYRSFNKNTPVWTGNVDDVTGNPI